MTELNEKEKSHLSHKSQHYLHGDTFTTKIKVELFETIGNLRTLVSSPAIHHSRGNREEVRTWHNARKQPHITTNYWWYTCTGSAVWWQI